MHIQYALEFLVESRKLVEMILFAKQEQMYEHGRGRGKCIREKCKSQYMVYASISLKFRSNEHQICILGIHGQWLNCIGKHIYDYH